MTDAQPSLPPEIGAPRDTATDAQAETSSEAGLTAFQALLASYAQLQRLTTEPIEFIDYGLCRIPIRGLDIPYHAPDAIQIHIYANELAVDPMAESGPREFPEGSMIVKEKRAAGSLAGLGMMIKERGSGWTYAYAEDGRLYEGVEELNLCRQCHLTGEVPEELVEELTGPSAVADPIMLPEPRDSVFLTLP